MSKIGTRWLKRAGAIALSLCLAITSATSLADTGAANNKFYNDYNSEEEALAAAARLNIAISEEGMTLLKNDGFLPMKGNESVSVFGVASDNLIGGAQPSYNLMELAAQPDWDMSMVFALQAAFVQYATVDALEDAGFDVNPTLAGFYANDRSGYTRETVAFDGKTLGSMDLYNDAAIIVLAREGGEGDDVSTVITELVKADDKHAALKRCNAEDYDAKYIGNAEYFDGEGYHYHKHYLMLTDSENELIDFVTSRFDNVIVVLNTSNVMEISELENNPKIRAIVDIQRPGTNGIKALPEILNGSVTPSGHLVDEWMRDLTTDPTWYNFGRNGQTNSSTTYLNANGEVALSGIDDAFNYYGVDYEEGIYLGYRYYETYYYDIYNGSQPIPAGYEGMSKEEAAEAWYAHNVAYAFGYGMSYTTFSMNAGSLYTDEALTQELGASVEAAAFEGGISKLYLPVTVTNTGDTSGKEVVQVYLTAPYTPGGIEKSALSLVGYGKTNELKPGQSQTVVVSFNVQDMASWDYNDANNDGIKGDYELDAGTYVIRAMESAHYVCGTDSADTTDAYDEVTFELKATAHQTADDYTGNELGNKFSAENGTFSEETAGTTWNYNAERTVDLMEDGTSAETFMSRADFAGTFPQSPTAGDLTFKQSVIENWNTCDNFELASGSVDTGDMPWYKDDETLTGLMNGWTQGVDSGITFADMAGVSLDDEETWTAFLNELSWDELCDLIEQGGYQTSAVASVGKEATVDADGPNNINSTYYWGDETSLSATFNNELAYKMGRVVGCLGMFSGTGCWYAPAMDTHRSPFSGRNNEYYSQDGIHAGYMAAAVVSGAESKGIVCYVKHLALNDQESERAGKVLFVWTNEQAIRELYLTPFRMALQEGGASAAMVGYARLGGIANPSNYNLMTGVLTDEWGWNGFLVTDGYGGWYDATSLDQTVRAGATIQLLNLPMVEAVSGEWDAEANSVRISLADGTSYISNLQYYVTRKAAQRVLNETANSVNAKNGFNNVNLEDVNASAKAYVTMAPVSVAISNEVLNGSSVSYAVTAGNLPEGLTLSSKDGSISGTPTVPGTYTATVTATIDSFVTVSCNVTIDVASAFYTDEDWDALDDAQAGKDFASQLESDVFTTKNEKYDTVVYSVIGGSLPAGLTLGEDGSITGTPGVAGTYSVTVGVTATKTITAMNIFGNMASKTTVDEGSVMLTIVVK